MSSSRRCLFKGGEHFLDIFDGVDSGNQIDYRLCTFCVSVSAEEAVELALDFSLAHRSLVMTFGIMRFVLRFGAIFQAHGDTAGRRIRKDCCHVIGRIDGNALHQGANLRVAQAFIPESVESDTAVEKTSRLDHGSDSLKTRFIV